MVRNHSLFGIPSVEGWAEIKKAMGDWKPPMALTCDLNVHAGARQTSPSMSCHHQ